MHLSNDVGGRRSHVPTVLIKILLWFTCIWLWNQYKACFKWYKLSLNPLTFWALSPFVSFLIFLVADTQLYKRLCPSVRPSVRRSVGVHESKSLKTHISAPAHPSATGGRVSGLVSFFTVRMPSRRQPDSSVNSWWAQRTKGEAAVLHDFRMGKPVWPALPRTEQRSKAWHCTTDLMTNEFGMTYKCNFFFKLFENCTFVNCSSMVYSWRETSKLALTTYLNFLSGKYWCFHNYHSYLVERRKIIIQ